MFMSLFLLLHLFFSFPFDSSLVSIPALVRSLDLLVLLWPSSYSYRALPAYVLTPVNALASANVSAIAPANVSAIATC
jgi:hypothetical protein